MYAMVGEGIFTQDGSAWKQSRKILAHRFVHMQYQNLEAFREHVDNLIDCLPTPYGVVDLQPLFFNLTLDTTTALLLGRSVHSLKGESGSTNTAFQENFKDIFENTFAFVFERGFGSTVKQQRFSLLPLLFVNHLNLHCI